MKPFLLALLLLSAPAFAGKSDIEKRPACAAGAPLRVVEVEPDIIVINYFLAQAQRKIWLRERLSKRPCDLPRRVRSKIDQRCYLPSKLPERR